MSTDFGICNNIIHAYQLNSNISKFQNLYSRNSEKPWQLEIKKAKTVLKKASSSGEALQSRRKRWGITWPWEEREEEEESEENRFSLLKINKFGYLFSKNCPTLNEERSSKIVSMK